MSKRRAGADAAASARARLLDLARRRGVDFQLLLSEFAIERLLFRIGVSSHADRFVLKGATLFKFWSDERRRATWDLDLLGFGANDVDEVVAAVKDLCAVRGEDGITFDTTSVSGEVISAVDEYPGVRVRLIAELAQARIPVQVDVGFGDAVVPAPRREEYPTLLDHPAPHILMYPRETVVAEKFEAMVSLGVTNSRMKDFYDLHRLASCAAFEGQTLVRAIRATFERRRTMLPDVEPLVLTPGFLTAPERQTQWRAFLKRSQLDAPPDIGELVDGLRGFLIPLLMAAPHGELFLARWQPGGPWLPTGEDSAK